MVEININPLSLYRKIRTKKPSLDKKDYIQLSGDLFRRVQLNKIFHDSKTFTDCIPLHSQKSIQQRYEKEKDNKDFNLKNFILENFQLPIAQSVLTETALPENRSVENYINSLWSVLYRNPDGKTTTGSSLIHLPHPYIVPGGRFREIYYWDSYFTSLGLVQTKMVDMVKNMCDNFCYLIDSVGHIPNANRVYATTRSQPPVFALMVQLLLEHSEPSLLHTYLPYVQKEYDFWMSKRKVEIAKNEQLNRYYDSEDSPREEAYLEERMNAHKYKGADKREYYRHNRAAAESGWDFSGRWFKDNKNIATCIAADIIPIDLNCLLYLYEKQLSAWYKTTGETKKSSEYLEKSTERVFNIQKYLYNKELGFFFDYHHVKQKQIQYYSLAGIFPLYAGIATREQAEQVATIIKEKFLHRGGLVTSLHETGEQWDYPNGWAPLQWIAIQGLKKYGFIELAGEIKARWLRNCENTFKQTGNMYEKYNVVNPRKYSEGGEYPVQTGFGWTNGVFIALLHDK